MDKKQEILRHIPSMTVLLKTQSLQEAVMLYSQALVTECAQRVVNRLRQEILAASERSPAEFQTDPEAVAQQVLAEIHAATAPRFRRVINATGIILHTNLGRALLSEAAKQAVNTVADRYSNLEIDLTTGERGSRYTHATHLLKKVTGAEDGLVVNNNAGAVLLVLSALCRGKEVVVSRGQLVEIGGAFRVPEVMEQSGAILREVGTTNKTRIADYVAAIGPETGALLKVHTSNYRIVGFTESVSLEELVALGRQQGIPVIDDLGSGALVNVGQFGLAEEPTVAECIAAGADIVTFSGDKLLGGPQAGIIVGRGDLIARIKKHPLTRALRVDKFTLAALEATLRHYTDKDRAVQEIPTLRMIATSYEELSYRAEAMAQRLFAELKERAMVELQDGDSQVGGGSLPTENLPTRLVAVKCPQLSADDLAFKLRTNDPPIIGRIKKDWFLIDPRTLQDGEDEEIIRGLVRAIGTERK